MFDVPLVPLLVVAAGCVGPSDAPPAWAARHEGLPVAHALLRHFPDVEPRGYACGPRATLCREGPLPTVRYALDLEAPLEGELTLDAGGPGRWCIDAWGFASPDDPTSGPITAEIGCARLTVVVRRAGVEMWRREQTIGDLELDDGTVGIAEPYRFSTLPVKIDGPGAAVDAGARASTTKPAARDWTRAGWAPAVKTLVSENSTVGARGCADVVGAALEPFAKLGVPAPRGDRAFTSISAGALSADEESWLDGDDQVYRGLTTWEKAPTLDVDLAFAKGVSGDVRITTGRDGRACLDTTIVTAKRGAWYSAELAGAMHVRHELRHQGARIFLDEGPLELVFLHDDVIELHGATLAPWPRTRRADADATRAYAERLAKCRAPKAAIKAKGATSPSPPRR